MSEENYANVLIIECPNCKAQFEIFKGIYGAYETLHCMKKCGEENLKELFKVIKEVKST